MRRSKVTKEIQTTTTTKAISEYLFPPSEYPSPPPIISEVKPDLTWKEYVSSESGFSVQYPATWIINKNPDDHTEDILLDISFINSSDESPQDLYNNQKETVSDYEITVFSNETNLDEIVKNDLSSETGVTVLNTTFQGLSAEEVFYNSRFDNQNFKTGQMYFIHNDKGFIISYDLFPTVSLFILPVPDIISTFKFF